MDQPIRSRVASEEYRKNWENVFGVTKRKERALGQLGSIVSQEKCLACGSPLERGHFSSQCLKCQGLDGG